MISIVICSRDKGVLHDVLQNVAKTIGVPHEVIAIDNSQSQYSIFQAYNIGTKQSNYDILCFMHEDISFETHNWGGKVLQLFEENNKLGLLGVAGSNYKPVIPCGWSAPYADIHGQTMYMRLIQSFKNKKVDQFVNNNPKNEILSKVVSIDGVWFCTRKHIAEEIGFDEITFKGFHCYDVDFSLGVFQKYDVAVTFEILLRHFSEGSFDFNWVSECIKLHNKWKNLLPINLAGLTESNIQDIEFRAFHFALPLIIGKKEIILRFLKFMWSKNIISLVGGKNFIRMNMVLIKKIIK